MMPGFLRKETASSGNHISNLCSNYVIFQVKTNTAVVSAKNWFFSHCWAITLFDPNFYSETETRKHL